MLGATKPLESEPGTIRGDLAVDMGRNICHASANVEDAIKEVALWFKDEELVDWKRSTQGDLYE
jgi:nucleoside-diphosphate kinase